MVRVTFSFNRAASRAVLNVFAQVRNSTSASATMTDIRVARTTGIGTFSRTLV